MGNQPDFQQRGREVQKEGAGNWAACALIFAIAIIRARRWSSPLTAHYRADDSYKFVGGRYGRELALRRYRCNLWGTGPFPHHQFVVPPFQSSRISLRNTRGERSGL